LQERLDKARVVHCDDAALKKLGALAHEEKLAAWDRGFNADRRLDEDDSSDELRSVEDHS
jgi:hypothetical protein